MAIAERDQIDVYEASDEDMRDSVQATLGQLGLSFAELAELADTGFRTEAQRRAWFAIQDLARFA